MRKIRAVFMRGGTSKGLIFRREDLPGKEEWDSIFIQAMGGPDPKQIDGMGGTVSSNNKVVVIWKSKDPAIDVEYLVGQVIVGKNQVDYKSNCGNMTAAVGPFAIDEGLVNVQEPITTVKMLNCNTNKRIDMTVPIQNSMSAVNGNCRIAGIDGMAAELRVNFKDPVGTKTGKLFPLEVPVNQFEIPGWGMLEATILDVSNPMVLVRAEDVGLEGTETPENINNNFTVCDLLENIRGIAACKMGFAKNLKDAKENSPAIPKIGVFTSPKDYVDLSGENVKADDMDICVRILSVFKCHKACPLTSACAIAVATLLDGTIVQKSLGAPKSNRQPSVRIGHPSGVMTLYPQIEAGEISPIVQGVTAQRTARRIMDGTLYIRD